MKLLLASSMLLLAGSSIAQNLGFGGGHGGGHGGHGGVVGGHGGGHEGGHGGYGHQPTYDNHAYYAFDYKVADPYHGVDFGHSEKRNGKVTDGVYHVQLPDGRLQTVKYNVDGYNGYVADVSYSGYAHAAPAYGGHGGGHGGHGAVGGHGGHGGHGGLGGGVIG